MATDVEVPALGESITEGTLAQWLKKPGEAVAADEPIASLETDKVSVEVPSPIAGVLTEQLAPDQTGDEGTRVHHDRRTPRPTTAHRSLLFSLAAATRSAPVANSCGGYAPHLSPLLSLSHGIKPRYP